MKLKEQISRIKSMMEIFGMNKLIKENDRNLISSFKRRMDLEYLDWLVDYSFIQIERQIGGICKMDYNDFNKGVKELVSGYLYDEYFYDILDYDNNDWDIIYNYIIEFIESEYGVELRYRYNKACSK